MGMHWHRHVVHHLSVRARRSHWQWREVKRRLQALPSVPHAASCSRWCMRQVHCGWHQVNNSPWACVPLSVTGHTHMRTNKACSYLHMVPSLPHVILMQQDTNAISSESGLISAPGATQITQCRWVVETKTAAAHITVWLTEDGIRPVLKVIINELAKFHSTIFQSSSVRFSCCIFFLQNLNIVSSLSWKTNYSHKKLQPLFGHFLKVPLIVI